MGVMAEGGVEGFKLWGLTMHMRLLHAYGTQRLVDGKAACPACTVIQALDRTTRLPVCRCTVALSCHGLLVPGAEQGAEIF
jgi:hypothetical protein